MGSLQMLSQIHGEKCWQSVDMQSPCEDACPIHTDVPSYVMAMAQGKFKEALDVIRENNPFPSICGRVCHHPCEEACTRGKIDKPIAIAWLKRLAADYVYENGFRLPRPRKRTKEEKIAIVGSGPAGLTAAYDLVRKGYGVTVYEALPVAGGMMVAGIPEFILPPEIVKKEIDYIKALGVDIKTNMPIGKYLTIDDLFNKGYKAVFLAIGTQRSLGLDIPGSDLKGVVSALPFLEEAKLGKKPAIRGKVVVIGGGNVAIDAARTAVRLGAEEVHLTCLESRRQMPAYIWEIERAEREGVIIHNSLAPQQFQSKPGKKVAKVDFKRVASVEYDSEGRISWTLLEGPGTEYSMDTNMVVVAIGQAPDLSAFGGAQFAVSGRGTFLVEPDTLATNVPSVFAGGDVVIGAGSVIEAIDAGHKAAEAIEAYLRGEDIAKRKPVPQKKVFEIDEEMIPEFLVSKARWEMPVLPVENRIRDFEEVMLGFTTSEGIEEARRCLNCRMCGNCIFERGQLCFEQSSRLLIG